MSLTEKVAAVEPHEPEPAFPWFDPDDPGVIRGELLGQEWLEARARRLAKACILSPPHHKVISPLLQRFAANGQALTRAHARIVRISAGSELLDLHAEWLVDNFRVIEEVLREVRRDLPRGYDAELPKLGVPPLRSYPRVYALALTLVAHTDGEVDEARLSGFVAAFQELTPLTIGELWALPTMLRLVLVENLRRLAEQVLWGWDERRRAEEWFTAHLAGDRTRPHHRRCRGR